LLEDCTCGTEEIAKVCVFFFYGRVCSILRANANTLGQKMSAQSAAVQVAETPGAVTVAADGPGYVDKILATVPAYNFAHE
tara:strand:- start:755 stop:997 length:243 start_codon:yes stop_codon:yes gene_type:complete